MKKILIVGAIILGSIGFSTSALAAIRRSTRWTNN